MTPAAGSDAAKLDDVDTMISRLETRLKQNYAGMNFMAARVYLIEVFVKGGKIEKYIS